MSHDHSGAPGGDSIPAAPVTLRFGNGSPLMLPRQVPKQRYRQSQSNIPDDKLVRARLKKAAEDHLRNTGAVPPLTLDELREHTAAILQLTGVDAKSSDYTA